MEGSRKGYDYVVEIALALIRRKRWQRMFVPIVDRAINARLDAKAIFHTLTEELQTYIAWVPIAPMLPKT